MIAFIIITHQKIGTELLETAQTILHESPSKMRAIEIDSDKPFYESQQKIQKALEEFQDADGVIFLTDIYGATPSNLCKEFLQNGKIEMITGCNLPIILKAAATAFQESPSQVAQFLKNYAKENIRVYSTDY